MPITTSEYIHYNPAAYPFHDLLKRIFGTDRDLSETHMLIENSDSLDVFRQRDAVKTKFHEMYYQSPHYPEWRELYYKFLREVIFPTYPETVKEFVVQKDPSFRIDIPNNTSIGIRDGETCENGVIGLHCDREFGHPPEEINYIVPFTDMYAENSVYVESAPNVGDFTPLTMSYGTYYRFWGNQCRHHNRINTTGVSRLSYDFRIIPMDQYNPDPQTPSYHNRKFVIGDYYISMTR